MSTETAEDLFKGVTFYIVGEITEHVIDLLTKYGGVRDTYLSEMVSHVIADDVENHEYQEARELFELPCVMSEWVLLSVKCNKMLPKDMFAPEGQLFSGVVACPSKLQEKDWLSLWAMIITNGGRCQGNLTNKCTHLLTSEMEGPKYEAALKHEDTLKVVTPDWVCVCIEKGEKQDEVLYHPRLVEYPKPPSPPKPPTPPKPPSPVKTEPMEVAPTGPDMHTQHYQRPTPMDDTPSTTRPGTPGSAHTKEALAKLVNNRKQDFPPPPRHQHPGMAPHMYPPGHPHHPGMPGAAPYTPPHPPGQQRMATPGLAAQKLRNITNNVDHHKHHKQAQNKAGFPPGAQGIPRHPPPQYYAPHPQQVPFPGQPPQPWPQYWGHDPTDNVPADMCLLGCIFYINDYPKIVGPEQIAIWKKVIEQHGGQVDPSYSNRVTHVMCANQKSEVFLLALRDQRRIVTAFWLNDVLLKKKLLPPWQAVHLPLMYSDENNRACRNQIICVSNFEDDDRTRVKQMINALGAKYTGYMTRTNSALVCRRPEGMKYNKAKEWHIPVVNVQWLSDLILGHFDALRLPINSRYLQVGQGDEFQMDVNRVQHLMVAWRTPLKVSKEIWKRFSPAIKKNQAAAGQENKSNVPPHSATKKQKLAIDPPPDFNTPGPRVLFTGFPKGVQKILQTMVQQLGGNVVENPQYCTHLVAHSFSRTMKFFIAINVCHHIISKQWVEDSHQFKVFQNEAMYCLQDPAGEAEIKCSLFQSLERAKRQPLFEGLTFYITPSVQPPVCDLKKIIESAGATLARQRRLAAKTIATLLDAQGNPTYIVITCAEDIHLCEDLINKQIKLYTAEFILTGVLRQEKNFQQFQIELQR